MKKTIRATLSVLVILVGSLALASPAHASAEHCLITTQGTDNSGNLIVTSTTCYKEFDNLLEAAGAGSVSEDVTPAQASSYLYLTSIIGVHYDGFNAAGSSFSVEGVDCNGGGLPVPAGWNDRISSTTNGCPTITHYQNTNYTGSAESTLGGGNHNLNALNNATSSLKYFN